MRRPIHSLLLPLLLLLAFLPASAQELTLPPGAGERLFSFTNRIDAFYCGVANGGNRNGFHGITRGKEKLFEQYWIRFGDEFLERGEAEVTVTPWSVIRTYARYRTTEECFFADSITLLGIRITSAYRGPVSIIPAFSQRWQGAAVSSLTSAPESGPVKGILLREKHRCVAAAYGQEGDWIPPAAQLVKTLKNPAPFSVPRIFSVPHFSGSLTCTIEFIDDAKEPALRSASEIGQAGDGKRERLQLLTRGEAFTSGSREVNDAYPWIRASLDALVTSQSGPGIYAGLPWFDDYWGRDTFISLPGTFLVTGDFVSAKRLLRSFSTFQNNNPVDPNFGRIPNRITPTEKIFNTADGTPWYVREVYEYMLYSGDRSFAAEMLPVVTTAIEGAKKHRIDGFGFLTHDDADSWMDAVGEKGAWSPRGTRAVEVQALWINQLEVSAEIAKLAGDAGRESEWRGMAVKAQENFRKKFLDPKEGILIDRLRGNNTIDPQIRPNTLIALSAPFSLPVSDAMAFRTLKKTMTSCIYPYGVSSLSQFDPGFHPYHQYPGYYPKDAAYHNGVIWTWLTGPAVTMLCRYGLQDSAFQLTEQLNRLAFSQGQVGSLPELTDAIARKGSQYPAWSGTFSQAWSLAEYLRNLYQDYMGIKPDMLQKKLHLSPRLPVKMATASAVVRIGASGIRIAYDFSGEKEYRCTLQLAEGTDSIMVDLSILDGGGQYVTSPVPLHPRRPAATFRFATTDKSFLLGDAPIASTFIPFRISPDERTDIRFCVPYLLPGLKSIKRPDHSLLEGVVVTSRNPVAPVLFARDDPAGDDLGPIKSYSYPSNAYFQKGIFDIRRLEVRSDNEMVYFTITMDNLVQPGWHPEYGFQLTMLALAIDQDGLKRKGSRYIRHNARVVLPDDMWYERLILVGGCIQVLDKDGIILCEYVPTEERYPVGDVQTKIISFAIPVQYLGKPHKEWDYYLVAGGQDDHGGAGIGEFRTVLPVRSEWNGGGNEREGPNVYDVLSSRE